MQFVAAGFDLGPFWDLTPRSYMILMRGAKERHKHQRLLMAEAVRAASFQHEDFQKWIAALSGQDFRLPPEVLDGALRRAASGLETITMGEALKRMH